MHGCIRSRYILDGAAQSFEVLFSALVIWAWCGSSFCVCVLVVLSNPRYLNTTPQNIWCSWLLWAQFPIGGVLLPALLYRSSIQSSLAELRPHFIPGNQVSREGLGCATWISGALIIDGWIEVMWVIGGTVRSWSSMFSAVLLPPTGLCFIFLVFSSSLRISLRVRVPPPHIIHCEISKHLRAMACCSDMKWMSWAWLLRTVFHRTDRCLSCSLQQRLPFYHQSTLDIHMRPLGGIGFIYPFLSFSLVVVRVYIRFALRFFLCFAVLPCSN